MYIVDQRAEAPDTLIAIGPSIAVELSWILLAAQRDQLCVNQPELEDIYLAPNGLKERVLSLWDDGLTDFGELLVLADLAGVIGSVDIDELLAGVAEAAVNSPKGLPLASESPADRAIFLQRLDRLRHSKRLRHDYVELLRDLWAQVRETWEREGHALAEDASKRYRQRLERGAKWVDLVVAECEYVSKLLPALVAELPAGSVVTVTPSYFFGQGLMFDLPHGPLVGVSARTTDLGARAKTDQLARRLKALADPTRLAIVHTIAARPMTVGEVAKTFDLAQPTVSNHVKLLREAGVLTASRHGTRVELEVRKDAGSELLGELKLILDREGKSDG